jgi:hypothetical protein
MKPVGGIDVKQLLRLIIYQNPKMGRTDRFSYLMMFNSLDAEQKELI